MIGAAQPGRPQTSGGRAVAMNPHPKKNQHRWLPRDHLSAISDSINDHFTLGYGQKS
jgi:hypothetical protein